MLTQTLFASCGVTGFSRLITGLRLAADTARHACLSSAILWRHESPSWRCRQRQPGFSGLGEARSPACYVEPGAGPVERSRRYTAGLCLFLQTGRCNLSTSQLTAQEGHGLLDPLL